MDVVLLGTGGGPGWPQPCCTCASCESAYAEGEIRAHTSALIDGVLLLDCGHDVPRSAARFGIRLDRLRFILVTHDHYDHADGALLLSRRWSGRREPLDVLGPANALSAMKMWLPPDEPGVTFRELSSGAVVDLDGYVVRPLRAEHDSDGALIYDIADADGNRLLYATDTGPGFDVPDDAHYDLVLLEESWGDVTRRSAGRHHDLTSFPATVARLRGSGALTAASRIVAVHLGHGNPAPSVLRRRLADWGAELLPDGAAIRVGTPAGRPELPRRVLVLGGARSGKSVAAERILAAEPTVCYVATSAGGRNDAEWAARIAAHQARRPSSWATLETTEVAALLRERCMSDPPLLVDCLTVWLSRVMDDAGVWSAADAAASDAADVALADVVDDLVDAWRTTRARVVAVSNEVGAGIVPEHLSGRRFRDELGALNARIAACSDDVVLVTAGISRSLVRAKNPWETW